MIKIIEPGSTFRIKCPVCRSILQYEEKDTFVERIGMVKGKVIVCPKCHEKIFTKGV